MQSHTHICRWLPAQFEYITFLLFPLCPHLYQHSHQNPLGVRGLEVNGGVFQVYCLIYMWVWWIASLFIQCTCWSQGQCVCVCVQRHTFLCSRGQRCKTRAFLWWDSYDSPVWWTWCRGQRGWQFLRDNVDLMVYCGHLSVTPTGDRLTYLPRLQISY